MTKTKTVTPARRAEVLSATRNLKMARSPHAYVRGSTARFYQWLENGGGKLPQGPSIWICGDCHVGNLGPIGDIRGRVAIQIRDLDQTVIGNPAHDLIRLALSLASAIRGSELPGVATVRTLEALSLGYAKGLEAESDDDAAPMPPAFIDQLLKRSTRRRWQNLAKERLNGGHPSMPIGRVFWPLSREERLALQGLVVDDELRASIAKLRGEESSALEVLDAAYWMKGCSSLGRLRYAAMLRVGEGGKSRIGLIDIKEAVLAAAPRSADAGMPRDNARRVIAGAKALSPYLGERMLAARVMGKAVVLRELMPQDLKIELERLLPSEAIALAHYLGAVVGRAHGRQMEMADRKAWRKDILRTGSSTLEAPAWLWANTVDLLGVHEAAYLEHCRRFALDDDKARTAA